MRTLRWTLMPLAVLSGLALLAGCGDSGGGAAGSAGSGGTPEKGGTAIIVELADMNRVLPLIEENSTDGALQAMMFMTLTAGEWVDGRLEYVTSERNPLALAKRYEYLGADSSALRYHLRGDVLWSDGRPVTARDAAFTYRIVRDPKLASPRQDFAEHMDSVVADDDTTVTFYFERRYPEMLYHSGLPLLPEHIYKDVDPGQIRTHRSVTNPENGGMVVNGPFRVGRWQRGSQVVLVPNPEFTPQPYLDQIVMRVIPEAATRLIELQTGNVDFVNTISFDQLPALEALGSVRLETEQRRFYDYIAYNPKAHPAFADPDVRRALGMALDLPAIINSLQMAEHAVPAGGPYSPLFKDLADPRGGQAPLEYDPEGAKRILASKGWRDANGDGILEKDGRALSFTLTTNNGNARRADVAQIAQQQWRQVGVNVKLQQQESNTFSDNLIKHEFDAALYGWSVGLSPDLSELWKPGRPFNFVSYDNPQVTRLIDQALAQPTTDKAAQYWKQAAALIVKDQPYTWLYFMDAVDGVNNRLRDTKVNTLSRYLNPWEWWIPKAQQRGGAAAKDTTTE